MGSVTLLLLASPEELGGLLLPIKGWARRAKTALDERCCEMWWLKWVLSAIAAIILEGEGLDGFFG